MCQRSAATSKSTTQFVPFSNYFCHILKEPKGTYRRWAKDNNFESRLAGDVKARKAAATPLAQQSSLNQHLVEKSQPERVVPYSDTIFRDAATEWLIATDQVHSIALCLPLSSLVHII